MKIKKKLLIIGNGTVTQHFINNFHPYFTAIYATSRQCQHPVSTKKMTRIPFNNNALEVALADSTHLIISTPPDCTGNDPSIEMLKKLLKKNQPHLRWVGYLSATSVYGQHHGKWVDESSEALQPHEKGIVRARIEQQWQSLCHTHHLDCFIFRIAGIYGPHHCALDRVLRTGYQTIIAKNQRFSRIHITDLIESLLRTILLPVSPGIYNLSDDLPATTADCDLFAAKLLHRKVASIPLEKAALSDQQKSFFDYSKRVDNNKIKKIFQISWQHPTYQHGLTKIFNEKFRNKD